MKKYLVLSFIAITVILLCCTPVRQVEYVIPDNYTGQTKDNLEAMLIKGQKLYKAHCAGCHGIFGKGKDTAPNFSKTQLENYRAAALLDDPDNHAALQKIRMEDLDLILNFLSFRKQKVE